MPATTPSKNRVMLVLAAIKESGHVPGEVIVAADGTLTVKIPSGLEPTHKTDAGSPPSWPDVAAE